MKKTFSSLTLALLVFTQCGREDKSFNAFFWISHHKLDSKLSLFVDGNFKGDLIPQKKSLTCDTDSLKQKAVFLVIKNGTHKLVAKDSLGTVISSATIRVTINSNSTGENGDVGGISLFSADDCSLIQFL